MTKISYFKTIVNTEDVANPAIVELEQIIKAIRNGNYKETVNKARLVVNKHERDKIKKQLPAALFAGEFTSRRIDAFVKSSNIVPIDYDDLTQEEMAKTKAYLSTLPYVIACFNSPSNNGVKALVNANFSSYEDFKSVFCAIDDALGKDEKFDISCSDISRACYMSYDPDIYYNSNSESFTGFVDDYEKYLKLRRLKTPENTFKHLIKWMDKEMYKYESGNRNNFVYILSSAMCRYGVKDETTKHLINTKYSDMEYSEIDTAVNSAYRRNEFGIVDISLIDPSDEKSFYKKIEIPDDTFDPSDVMVNPEHTNGAVYSIAHGEMKFDSLGLVKLDRYFVLKRNELYGFVAGSKAGKTLSISYISMLAAKNAQWKFLVLTTETEIEDYKSTMVGFYNNKPIRKQTDEEIHNALVFIDNHFQFIYNEVNHTQILDVYHYCVSKNAYFDCIIIDPITNISKSKKIEAKSGNDYYEELYVRYLKFAKKYCSLWVIAHTVTSKERERTIPFVQDAEYGVQLARRCHYGITFFRDAHDAEKCRIVECHVRYVRTSLTRGGSPTMDSAPILLEFIANMDEFGYNVSVDGFKYKNPLHYRNIRADIVETSYWGDK